MRANIDSDERVIIDANQRFHRLIAGATGNLVVQVFTETLMTVADSGVTEIEHSKAFKKVTVDGHDRIIAALDAKDPEAAEQAMRDHVTEGKRRRVKENKDLMARPLRWVQ